MNDKIDFGFKQVNYEEKQNLVANIFSSVADKYDLMNDLMSFGVHRLWKNILISHLEPNKALLDMASGTGDIAKLYYKKSDVPDITLCDINFDMLNNGRNKLFDQNIFKGLKFACCNAETLPFDEFSFDYYSIAFGIRNVTNIKNALQEACRVLRPGGKFVCLEFGNISNGTLAKFYDCYSMNFIPKIGSIVTGDADAYQYLVESIRMFPEREKFKTMMEESGFKLCKFESLSFGIVTLYTGYKI